MWLASTRCFPPSWSTTMTVSPSGDLFVRAGGKTITVTVDDTSGGQTKGFTTIVLQ